MPDNEKLSGKVGLDTTDFKTNVAAMNRELRVLESGFRASAAGLGDWANDASGLELRIKSLSGQMDVQKTKVAAVRTEYERIKAEKGETSRAAQDLEIKLNKETETLGKMESELRNTEGSLEEMRRTSNDTGEAVDDLGKESQTSTSKLERMQIVLGGLATVASGVAVAIAAVAAATAAVAVAIGGMVISSANAAAELVDLSAQTGISTTRLQELAYIGDQVGTSLDTITGAQARLVRSMFGAKDGTGEQAKAFAALGISVMDARGNLRDSEEVFAETINALGRVGNETERDALAMAIFGKSAMELNPLIKAGSAEMARLADEAHEVGAVMSEEDVAALEAFDDTLASLQAGLKGTLGTLSVAFLPAFEAIFGTVGEYLKEFSKIVKSSGGDFGKLATGLTGLVTKIAQDMAKQAPQMLQAGLGIVKGLIEAILKALPALLDAGVEILLSLVKFIIQNLPLLINAGLQAIIALANGLAAALPELIPAIVEAVVMIVETLVENVPLIIDGALALILGLAEGLVAAIPVLIPAIPKLVEAIVAALVQALPAITRAAGELVAVLALGIIQNIPVILQAALELVRALVFALIDLSTALVEAGIALVEGLWEGFKSRWEWFKSNIVSAFQELMAWIKNLLGIASPSKFGIEVGRNVVSSIGLGGLRGLDEARRSLQLAMQGMQFAMVPAGGAFSSVTNSENIGPFYAPVYIQGNTTPGSLGSKLKGRRF